MPRWYQKFPAESATYTTGTGPVVGESCTSHPANTTIPLPAVVVMGTEDMP